MGDRRMKWFFLAAALATPQIAAAADAPAHLSLVAGYKAAFVCSARFNAGRTLEEIEDDELHRIYPDYREAMARLPDPVIDDEKKTVTVAFADGFPPRIASWRPFLGCVQSPSGATESVKAPRLARRAAPDNADRPWPVGDRLDREVFADTPQGFNLAGVVADAFDRKTYGAGTETTAVLVIENGTIVAEKYRDGFDMNTPQRTWSVAKSIAATIVGAAVEDGLVDIDAPAGLSQWRGEGDPRGAITLRHLLQMASGLDSTPAGNRTDNVYFGGGRVIDHAATRRLVSVPGSTWVYANNDTMLAMRALRERMKSEKAYLSYPFEQVLDPLGMDHTFLETDWNGDFIASSQVWTTARDLARIGLLYLADGMWNGKRILPEDWAAFVATPAPAQPPETGAPRPGYGAQFWLYGEEHGLPKGTYAARGNRGQFLVIIPQRNVLIVRRGFDDGGGFDIARFSADVLKTLETN
ncbi:MAG: serine hydrolase [Parvularculaceae bacterium]|nr:serine hydrolase [Parvularculaceae bacterium]